MQGTKLSDQYAHDVGFNVVCTLSREDASGISIKQAVDLRDQEDVTVWLIPRGRSVRVLGPPCHNPKKIKQDQRSKIKEDHMEMLL
jgi:hypothetical protein